MDDEEVFGPVAYRYPFRRAISDGWLKDYRIVIATVTSRQVAELLDGNSELAGEGDVPVRMAAAQAALAMAAARVRAAPLRGVPAPRRPGPPVRRQPPGHAGHAARPAAARPGRCRPGTCTAKMTSLQRDLALDRLRTPPGGGWAVVANARCLAEGIDIPAIDSVLFGAPKESVTDIVQAVGRALRRHGDADTATIIVPALLPDADDSDGGRAGRDREPVRDRAPRRPRDVRPRRRPHRRARQAARVRRAADPAGQPAELPSRITVLAPPGTLQATLDALRIQVLSRATSSWWDGYGHARAYHDAHGDLDVPVSLRHRGRVPARDMADLPARRTQPRRDASRPAPAAGRSSA